MCGAFFRTAGTARPWAPDLRTLVRRPNRQGSSEKTACMDAQIPQGFSEGVLLDRLMDHKVEAAA
jgi:hypothetical protein